MSKIKSRQDAAEKVRVLAHLTALLGCAAAARDQDVLNAQEKHQPLINQLSAEIAAGEADLRVWADANRKEEFGEAQSLEFPHGFLKFRQGTRALDTLSGWTWPKVLKKLQSLGAAWEKYIRTKAEPNKQLLLAETKAETGAPALPPEMLRTIGLKVVAEERFEVECKPEASR